MISRIMLTLASLFGYSFLTNLYGPVAQLVTGKVAGDQFQNSDVAYLKTMYTFSFFNGVNSIFSLALLLVLIAIWFKPVKSGIAAMIAASFAMMVAVTVPEKAFAFAAQTDKTEMVLILPNHSAFWVPNVGANKTDQAEFDSEAYYNDRKIAAKQFNIPHSKLAGSNGTSWTSGWDYYVPTGRLFIVDRSPITRLWVQSGKRGTSTADESFPCQSKEGLNITAGVAIGIYVTEQDAAKYLFHFGVIQPKAGTDLEDPQVIYQSVYFGRPLEDVADKVIHKEVASLVCHEIETRTLDDANANMSPMMASIETSVRKRLASEGITLDFIGWADTFSFDPDVQTAINHKYSTEKLASSLSTLSALAMLDVQRGLGTGLASHGLPFAITPGMMEMIGTLIPHPLPAETLKTIPNATVGK